MTTCVIFLYELFIEALKVSNFLRVPCMYCSAHGPEKDAAVAALTANVSALDALVERVHSLQSGLPSASQPVQSDSAHSSDPADATMQASNIMDGRLVSSRPNVDGIGLQHPGPTLASMSRMGHGIDACERGMLAGQNAAVSQEERLGHAAGAGMLHKSQLLQQKTQAEEWLVSSSDDGTCQPGPPPPPLHPPSHPPTHTETYFWKDI